MRYYNEEGTVVDWTKEKEMRNMRRKMNKMTEEEKREIAATAIRAIDAALEAGNTPEDIYNEFRWMRHVSPTRNITVYSLCIAALCSYVFYDDYRYNSSYAVDIWHRPTVDEVMESFRWYRKQISKKRNFLTIEYCDYYNYDFYRVKEKDIIDI